jgi:hypothetical protein
LERKRGLHFRIFKDRPVGFVNDISGAAYFVPTLLPVSILELIDLEKLLATMKWYVRRQRISLPQLKRPGMWPGKVLWIEILQDFLSDRSGSSNSRAVDQNVYLTEFIDYLLNDLVNFVCFVDIHRFPKRFHFKLIPDIHGGTLAAPPSFWQQSPHRPQLPHTCLQTICLSPCSLR